MTNEENTFVDYYNKFYPVVDSNCVMNRICKYIESIDFTIKQKVRSSSDFDYKMLMSDEPLKMRLTTEVILPIVEDTINWWKEEIKQNKGSKLEKSLKNSINSTQKKQFTRETQYIELKSKLLEVCPSEETLTNSLIYIFYELKPSYGKGHLWILCGKQIYEHVRKNHSMIYFPIKEDNGIKEFLYEKYSIEPVDIPQIDNSDIFDKVALSQLGVANGLNTEEEESNFLYD